MKRKKEKEAVVSMAQLGIWTALILVQMVVVNCLQVQAGMEEIQKEIVYQQVETREELPEQIVVNVEWKGEAFSTICESTEKEIIREYWQEDFSFPITFHLYGADYYQVGNQKVPYNESKPELADCYGELLDMIGVSEAKYKIKDVGWSGEAYVDEQGETCRDAVAVGERLLGDWRVSYRGSVELPDEGNQAGNRQEEMKEEILKETEETIEETKERENEQIQIEKREATFAEDLSSQENSSPDFWGKITTTFLIAIGVGAILFFGGLLLLGIVRLVKIITLCYTDRKEKRSIRRSKDVYRK